ncbi:hypothetical protein JK359_10240 [Streptomyces actinomycinicus]|uniref:Uncharacterized protein n=1 Tax=Streptomyces actinomycinicus TaxID=1695166 RepID=A0A937EG19_9ACTN|nr:hypothetical protein [Streptomyces actinomycinicus]MBL1082357.1 hypothetical protein [Streptomyces actinomycinicus]
MQRLGVRAAVVAVVLLIVAAGSAYLLLRPDESADSVRFALVADSRLSALALPGDPDGTCEADASVCRSVLRVEKNGEVRKVLVTARDALPEGVRLAYWGCREGPGSSACTVRQDRDATICVTTTGPVDVARKACGNKAARPAAGGPGKLTVIFQTKWKIDLFGNFKESCGSDGTLGKKCEIPVKQGKIYYLRAQPASADDPYAHPARKPGFSYMYVQYEGCNSGLGHGDSITCAVFGSAGKSTVCVSTGDEFEQKSARACLAYRRTETP